MLSFDICTRNVNADDDDDADADVCGQVKLPEE